MNDIEYIFEGHDLTKEVVMVQVRDNQDEPWSVPQRLGMICPKSNYPFVIVRDDLSFEGYKYARLAIPTIKPWTLKTAPRHLEVEFEDDLFYVALKKSEFGASFFEGESLHIYTWDELTQYKQWDGSPCGEVVE